MSKQIPKDLFDLAEEYDAMLNRGLRVTGEDKSYFAHGRIRALRELYIPDFHAADILDFGSGIGDTSRILAQYFHGARVVGVDTSESAVAWANQHNSGDGVSFQPLSEFAADGGFDLVYVNGVFHHIVTENRAEALGLIRDALRPGGRVAFFENNPWSIPARIVMSRIPFDKDARMVSPRLAASMLSEAGFRVDQVRYLFFFPGFLSALRSLEPRLARVPLGAQYLVVAIRD